MEMADYSNRSKLIAKNTIFLYGRMLLMMLVSLYTSRVILNALGVEDYGIYNVVGGVVSMFTILSGTFSAAIGRFITFELGRGDIPKLHRVFCASINVQILLIIIIIILLESIGLWFLNYKLVIPLERMEAANWVFQISMVTFAVNLWSAPYYAEIIAHEKMSFFAFIGLFDSFVKLLIAYAILRNPIDRLVFYSLLLLISGFLQCLFYTIYCKYHFEECNYNLIFDKKITKEIFGFSGWNFIGAASSVLRDQGGNIIINIFCGPTVNAARGIAMQINNSISGFVNNFMTALNPQITKSYASGESDYMFMLIYKGARFSYYILLLLALPIIFSTHYLLELWLGIVPEHADSFAQLILILTLTDSLANPLVTAMLATGNIKKYQIVVGGLQLINLPMYYVFLLLGYPPECVFVISIVVSFISEIARIVMLKGMIGLSVVDFFSKVILNVICVTLMASIVPYLYKILYWQNSFLFFCEMTMITFISALLCILYIGCDKQERQMICQYRAKLISKLK